MKKKLSPSQKALNLWAVILIVWSVYRAKFSFPEWIDEFIAKPLVFIFPLYYYITRVEKKDFFRDLYLQSKSILQDILLGGAVGVSFYLTGFLASYFKFNRFTFLPNKDLSYQTIILYLSLSLATGISEEILSRGFVLKRLYQESKNILSSSFFASILFFFLHVPILFTSAKFYGSLLLFFMTTDIILSLTLSFIFLERKSLVLPILIHALYNLTISIFV